MILSCIFVLLFFPYVHLALKDFLTNQLWPLLVFYVTSQMNTSWSKMRRREQSMRFLLLVLTQTPLRPSRAAIARTGGYAKICWWIQQALISKYWFYFLFFSCQLWRGEIIPSRWKMDCFYFCSVSILPSCSWPMQYGFMPALSLLVKSHQKILKTQEAGRRAINNLAMSKMS